MNSKFFINRGNNECDFVCPCKSVQERDDQIRKMREEAGHARKKLQQQLEEEMAQQAELKEQVEHLSLRKEELKQQLNDKEAELEEMKRVYRQAPQNKKGIFTICV